MSRRVSMLVGGGVVVLFLGAWWWSARSPGPAPQPRTPAAAASLGALGAGAPSGSGWVWGDRARAEPITWGRDPFSYGTEQGTTLPQPKAQVTGIFVDDDPGATYAIVNGEVVRVGDGVEGGEVVAITPNTVVIRTFDREVTVTLWEDPGKPAAEVPEGPSE